MRNMRTIGLRIGPATGYRSRRSAAGCLQNAYSGPKSGQCKQKRPRGTVLTLDLLRDLGAGEGIRTLDPNLGKVAIPIAKTPAPRPNDRILSLRNRLYDPSSFPLFGSGLLVHVLAVSEGE